MAVAFRSAGARLKADVGTDGASLSVALPPGHVAGDLVLLFVVTDDNTGVTSIPPGWGQFLYLQPGGATSSSQNPYNASPRTMILARIDNGALGSSVPLQFSASPWPGGSPYVLAWTAAWSGTDPAFPLQQYAWRTSTDPATVQAMPVITTTTANAWLASLRVSSAPDAATFTNSVAGDAERVDDTGVGGELSAALYDSNTALAAGAQPQRTLTASRTSDYGSVLVSFVLKPPASGSTAAPAGEGDVTATAYPPTVLAEDGPWALCGDDGMPRYRVAVDWSGDGSLAGSNELGAAYVTDAFGRTVAGGWGAADTGQAWTVGGGTASDFSVSPGRGVMSLSTTVASRFAVLDVLSPDVDLAADFSLSATAAGADQVVYLMARYTDGSNFYYARVNLTPANAVVLALRRRVAGVETELALRTTDLTHTAGTWYTLRLRVLGSVLWAKVWPTGTSEPVWQTIASDTGLQGGPRAGVRGLLSAGSTNTLPVAVSFDNFRASAPLDEDDVTDDVLPDVTSAYGRDQERQLAPAAVGSASFSLNNASRRYSPENGDSPLSGNVDPARAVQAQVIWNGQTYPLFTGKIDDYSVKADYGDRTVDLSVLDGLSNLSGVPVYTGLYSSLRTGDLVNVILDEAGWTGGRDIDPGATVVKWWWLDGTDALTAVNDLVKSEGPPAVAYVAPDGTFTFRDRHHRMLRQASRTAQAVFHAGALGDCTDEGVPAGALSLARPFSYAHGWKDIVNSVSFDVEDRAPSGSPEQVWQDDSTRTLSLGESVDLTVSSSDPFVDAVTPVVGTDLLYTGTGVVSALLSRTAGMSARLTLRAVGGPVTITFLQVRARLLAVRRTVRVSATDEGSISRHGERAYPDDAPWAGPEDAQAIAGAVLLHYAERRPTVQIRLVSSDPAHLVQVLSRTVSDRVRIVNEELRLDSDFFVERVQHTVQRTGRPGRPPVHAVVLGCEKDMDTVANPFSFDVRGAGFDQGVFDPYQADDAERVFIFDDPVQGLFNTGEFGT